MKRTTLNQKAWSIVGLLWISLVVLVLANAFMTRSGMVADRKALVEQETQTALGVVSYYQKEAAAGHMSADDAKRLAIATLRGTRYGDDQSGYFGIYDSNALALLVPPKPEMEGKSQANLTDPRGTHVALEIVKSSSTGGNGYSSYWWPKPGKSAPVEKITYSALVPGWDWHLFTGIYTDDIDDAFRNALIRNLILVTLIGAAVTLGLTWLIRTILRSLGGEPEYASQICQRIAEGDLTAHVNLAPGDQRSLLHSMQQMQRQLVETVQRIQTSAESITTGAKEIAAGNLDLSSRTEEQAASLEETAASIEELTTTVKHNTDNARQGNTLAVNASEVAARGGEVVRRVVETMNEISSSSQRVEQIIGVIDGIAFQTNILALNAAVEAARAGDQGRGFAVVAGEVRSLAQRSATAAKEIKDLIGQSVAQVSEGTRLVDEAGKTIDEVVVSARRVADLMGEIAAASEEQHTGIEQVNRAVAQMDEVTQQNAALVEEASAAAQSMAAQSNGLRDVVTVFRVGAQAEPTVTSAVAAPAQRARAVRPVTPLTRPAPSPAKATQSTPARKAANAAPAAPAKAALASPVAAASNETADWETF
ncbi:methyl-accepting chemotaxis protein [Paraburkholderia silvatlantica]|uniref:Methyl-accepting chemotaxis protein n=1 Tax=Paraburkholderia silvatlantica TaxID=321895 RepID=A0ABR6FHJ7_9BURK|nr:methyl-accepting chemotaxis protein [Paraburkholderia silvatlantica]MBB2926907.1 methyl-accepting chemotaxis protein [Paraburkholderia silvatlantica]PVY37470.1 methyl-accepting chemotaxis sensory transducer with Cache sensor [Paraburkholderia silvatlantica]PXW42432.1 methyl-accepting chemotaxis sensory transducer with Cache sensor [Paraburkholderia silvatlantica]